MKQTLIDILIVSVVPLLIVVGYYSTQNDSLKEALLSISGKTTATTNPGDKTAQALTKLEAIRLDGTIFEWKEFQTLKKPIEVPVRDEPIGGKKNPFEE
jgi:hypothetical protein